ncbi:MAG: MarR family winged helix-turn-helix transcriptional regulator [Candidatus Nanopelagicales bacterium]|nr:winged helix-turn-helix transcriptional regulator [Actinomycetota bacterium]HNE89139.1 MarR family winged helix-turn-helix transcriptional regulator [Actinomycetota bacterium]HNL52055.1 MarR family winged helix-turn-helix transcriptional regulator [Actinomycetota bacterium]HNO14787.1 MarR family winged helix-turn-helix transcriptional regulator [Actinomycetota bacterium]HUM86007.1 MarR family winged helix-turn-helix transcriptional regulator [Actinomycetota bacterium]
MRNASDSIAEVLREWAEVRPDLDVSPVGVLARMARIRAIVEVEQAKVFASAGITPADFPVLVTLRRRQEPVTHTQLSEALGLTPGTVSVRVDRLVALGLAVRDADPSDARVRWVRLTAEGSRLIDDLIPQHLAVEEQLLAGLRRKDRQRLAADLSVLLADLEARYT